MTLGLHISSPALAVTCFCDGCYCLKFTLAFVFLYKSLEGGGKGGTLKDDLVLLSIDISTESNNSFVKS